MQFRARLAQVNGTSPRSDDAPNVIAVKLEPTELLEADWLFSRLGCYLVVNLLEVQPSMGPLFEAEDTEVEERANGYVEQEQDEAVVPSSGRRRHGTRSSEQA
jgi:hypothetical protein